MNAEAKGRVRWAIACMTCAVAVFGTVLWHEMPASPSPRIQSLHPARVSQQPVPAIPIPRADPTGKASVLGTAASVSSEPIRLKLFATSPGTNPREGIAILGTDPLNPQTYGVGSVLASGARVEAIFGDYVVLRFNGTQTRLYREGAGGATTNAVADVATTIGGPRFAEKPVDTHPSSQEDFVDILRSRLVFDGEKVSGFEVSGGRRRDQLSALGFESGDVIRSIDGRPVTKDSDWQRIAKALASGGSIVLGVERQGSLMSISMDASQVKSSEVAATAPPIPPST